MTWLTADDPANKDLVITVGSRLLFGCSQVNEEEGLVEVAIYELVHGKPLLAFDGDQIRYDQVALPMIVSRDPAPLDNSEWLYRLTGDLWCDQNGTLVPDPRIVIAE